MGFQWRNRLPLSVFISRGPRSSRRIDMRGDEMDVRGVVLIAVTADVCL
jgi:hypothetical protein